MSKCCIIITCAGVLSAVGLTVQDNWDSLLAGKSDIGYLTQFNTDMYSVRLSGTNATLVLGKV